MLICMCACLFVYLPVVMSVCLLVCILVAWACKLGTYTKCDCTQTNTNTGLFEEFRASEDEQVVKIGKRWSQIKAQAMDSGLLYCYYFAFCV